MFFKYRAIIKIFDKVIYINIGMLHKYWVYNFYWKLETVHFSWQLVHSRLCNCFKVLQRIIAFSHKISLMNYCHWSAGGLRTFLCSYLWIGIHTQSNFTAHAFSFILSEGSFSERLQTVVAQFQAPCLVGKSILCQE